MKTTKPHLACGFLLLWCAATASAQQLPTATPQEVGLSPEKLAGIEPVVQAFVDDRKVAGAVTIVARRGKVVHRESLGVTDVKTGKPMKTDAIFRTYSMSKPVTTVAAMILWEEGRFKLDDPVAKFIPEFKGLKVYSGGGDAEANLAEQKREMTIRDLMRHTSGLSYGIFSNTPVDKLYREKGVLGRDDLKEMVRKLGQIPLLYQPGTKFHYSVSTDVLGRLVEVISEKTLDEFFRQRIFRPLGMKDTRFHVPKLELDRFASNHGLNDKGELAVTDAPATSRYRRPSAFLSGGGGLVSTADDYMRFCLMLQGGGEFGGKRLLREKTVKMMTSNQLPDVAHPIGMGGGKREGVGFGLGFSVRTAKSTGRTAPVGEYGWGGAASTHFWISPKDELIVIALQQFMPYSGRLETAIKPLVYGAIVD